MKYDSVLYIYRVSHKKVKEDLRVMLGGLNGLNSKSDGIKIQFYLRPFNQLKLPFNLLIPLSLRHPVICHLSCELIHILVKILILISSVFILFYSGG